MFFLKIWFGTGTLTFQYQYPQKVAPWYLPQGAIDLFCCGGIAWIDVAGIQFDSPGCCDKACQVSLYSLTPQPTAETRFSAL